MKLNSILVLLNYPRPEGLLKIAAELAHKIDAELRAVYLEDTSWFEVSSFSKQVSGFRGEIQQFSEKQLTWHSQALATRYEKIFKTYSQSLKIKHSYRIVRGFNAEELSDVVSEIDLLIMPGNIGQAEYKDKLAEQFAVPVLIWNNGSYWPKEVIGLCTSTEKIMNLVRWTIELGETINRSSRLFWDERTTSFEEWFHEISDTGTVSPVLLKTIRDLSEVHTSLSADFLQYFRNALLVTLRKDLKTVVGPLHQSLPNSILLL